MKANKKLALVSAIAAISSGVQAELTALDDSAMSGVTGRAGLTIDIETKWRYEEFAYKDGGFVILQGVSVGGSQTAEELAFSGGHGFLDNLRANWDVAGNGAGGVNPDNVLAFGFSDMTSMANTHVLNGNSDSGMLLAAGITTGFAEDQTTGLMIDTKRTFNDGDLLIHLTHTDGWQKGGGFEAYQNGSGDDGFGGTASLATLGYDAAREFALRAVDYNLTFEIVGIADSNYNIGSSGIETYLNGTTGKLNGTDHASGLDATSSTTALLSGIDVNGHLGPLDIYIENDGNGFGADGSGHDGLVGTGNADSIIEADIFFDVSYDYYLDIAGVQFKGIHMHNQRGDLGSMHRNALDTGYTSSFGMAHARRTIYAVKDTVLHVNSTPAAGSGNPQHYADGMAYHTEYKGEFDIGELSFGDTGISIGEIYMTDIELTRNWIISSH